MRLGANVQIAYYDQQREQLDPERTVFDTVGEGNDTVTVERPHAPRPRLPARLPVLGRARAVAGEGAVGRRAQPAAAGAAVHAAGQRARARRADQRSRSRDARAARGAARRVARARCCSSATTARFSTTSSPARSCSRATAACRNIVGGYEDWLRQRPAEKTRRSRPTARKARDPEPEARPRSRRRPKIVAQARRSCRSRSSASSTALPAAIEALETEQRALAERIAGPEFYKEGADAIKRRSRASTSCSASLPRSTRAGATLDAQKD